MNTPKELFVRMALDAWTQNTRRLSAIFDSLSNEQYRQEIAPGRNRPVYLLGHLTAAQDMLLPLLGLGERNFPELDGFFINYPDKAIGPLPPLDLLKAYWTGINKLLNERFATMTTEDWFCPHTVMTEEEWDEAPWQNRLGMLMARTNHLAWHTGQLALVW